MDVTWISHRGLHSRWTENTLNAFHAAVDAGFHELETDLRCSHDGRIILHHDPTLKRTAGQSVPVSRLSSGDFRSLRYPDGQAGLTFDYFARTFTNHRWILDIKPETGKQTLRALHSWAQRHRCQDWLCQHARFLLWQPAHTRLLYHYFPKATTMANQSECRRAGVSLLMGLPPLAAIRRERTYSLPPQLHGLPLLRHSLVRTYQRRGARVLAFLPEGNRQQAAAIESGVDEILSNDAPLC